MIFYFPGLLIGEIVTVALKVILKIFNTLISFIENLFSVPSPYVRGTFDVVFEAFTMTLLGRAVGIYIMIFIPILIFKKLTKLNINWLPSIFLLIPTSKASKSVDGKTCGVSGYSSGSRAPLKPPPLNP